MICTKSGREQRRRRRRRSQFDITPNGPIPFFCTLNYPKHARSSNYLVLPILDEPQSLQFTYKITEHKNKAKKKKKKNDESLTLISLLVYPTRFAISSQIFCRSRIRQSSRLSVNGISCKNICSGIDWVSRLALLPLLVLPFEAVVLDIIVFKVFGSIVKSLSLIK